MVNVELVENTDTAPFVYYDSAEITLTNDGNLYADGHDGNVHPVNVHNGVDFVWGMSTGMRGDAINKLLKEIKPLAAKILENHSAVIDTRTNNLIGVDIDQDFVDDLYYDIRKLIKEYEDDDRNIVSLLDWEDWFLDNTIPPEARRYIESGEGFDDGVMLTKDTDTVYAEMTEDLAEKLSDDIISSSNAGRILIPVYADYVDLGFKREFWEDLVPLLVEYDDELMLVDDETLMYEDDLIEL